MVPAFPLIFDAKSLAASSAWERAGTQSGRHGPGAVYRSHFGKTNGRKIQVRNKTSGPGTIFEVELPTTR